MLKNFKPNSLNINLTLILAIILSATIPIFPTVYYYGGFAGGVFKRYSFYTIWRVIKKDDILGDVLPAIWYIIILILLIIITYILVSLIIPSAYKLIKGTK